MFALTILYAILFVYIFLQSRKFTNTQSSVDNHSSGHELQRWQGTVDTEAVAPQPGLQRVLTTQTVTVITETHASAIRRVRRNEDNSRRRMTQVAVRLLCYPIVYISLTMPVSIARLAQLSGHNWGLTAILVGAAVYVCSGWVNVFLYTATRKGFISWDWLAPRRRREEPRLPPGTPVAKDLHLFHFGEPSPGMEKLGTDSDSVDFDVVGHSASHV